MVRVALRSLLAHRLRLALTVLTVALGIAFITGTSIFTTSLRGAFDALIAQPRADVTIRAGATEGNGAIVVTLPESLVAEASRLPGAATAQGLVTAESTYVLDAAGAVVGVAEAPARARSWVDDPAISPVTITSGRPPSGPGEVALLQSTAADAGVDVGATVRIDTPNAGVREFAVSGLVDRGLSGGLGGTLVVFDLPTAQTLLTKPGTVSAVLLTAQPGVSQEALAAQAETIIPVSARVETAQQAQDDVVKRIEEGFGFFNTFLLAFGAIALFVSTFLIFNTFSMLVAQRTRELAFLRAVGASRAQVFLAVVGEALAIGLIAAAIGIIGGLGVSVLLRWVITAFGADLPGAPLSLTPSTVIFAVGVGVVVTVVSALVPARRASAIPPVAAMREGAGTPPRSLRRVTVVGLALLVLSIPAAAQGLRLAETDGERAAQWTGAAALVALVGVLLVTPAIAIPVLSLAQRLMRRLLVGRLAALNAVRNPRRTAATASALTIGLALMTAVSVLGSSARASVENVVDTTIGADFVVVGPGFRPFTPDVYRALQGMPGTSVVTYVRTIPVTIDGSTTPVTGVDPASIREVLDIQTTSGSVSDLALGAALVDTDVAQERGLAVGDTVTGTFVNGEGSLRIVGTFTPAGPVRGFITTLSTVDSIGSLTRDTAVYVALAPGASADAVRSEMTTRLAPFPSVRVQDQADIKREINAQFDVLFGLVYALLGLSVIVAFLGIVNTLSLGVVERTRELGLLRAIGMSRGQLRRMIAVEAALLAILGTLIGLALGLACGLLLQRVLAPQGIDVLAVPVPSLVIFAVLATVGGLAASLWPAWRAGRMRVLSAIAQA
ncbi:MAG: ABC transporter permease [Candidatus Nanopelagicales bacterium]